MSAAERLKLVPHKPTDSEDAASLEPSTDSILQIWLNAAVAALPTSHRDAIQSEIEDHITERVRELTVAGENEHHALARALQEFGNPAVFTRNLARARRAPFRRHAMNSAIIAASGIALITSLVAVTQPATTRHVATEAYAPAPKVNARLSEESSSTKGPMPLSLSEALRYIAACSGLELVMRTAPLSEQGIDQTESLNLSLSATSVADAFEEIHDARGLTRSELDYRVHDGQLEVATRDYFDTRETRLVSIDAGEFLAGASREERMKLQDLITELVEPEGWANNGGTTARMSIVGGTIFVKAPPRYVEQIQWIVAKLNTQQPADNDHAKAIGVPMLKDLPIVEGNPNRDPRVENNAINLKARPSVQADSIVLDGLVRGETLGFTPIEGALSAKKFIITTPAQGDAATNILVITSESGKVTIRTADPNPQEPDAPHIH